MPGEGYSLKKTVWKFVKGLVIAFIGFALPYTIIFIEGEEWPVEYALYIPFIIGLLTALQNAWVHWNDPVSPT